MNENKIQIGTKVQALVSAKKGQFGKIVSFGKNPRLPIAVEFNENPADEWDFKQSELRVVGDEE